MTRTTDTTATDAQYGDQSPGRGASAQADADDGSGSSSPEREAATERSDGVDRRHRERSVVVGEDTAEREVVVREGAVETVPPATGTVGTVRVPAAASPAEADAIAAAVREHLVATGSASATADSPARWVAAGRVRGVVSDPEAVLDDAESDPWIAASRAHDRR
jgi:hypothetical protein